MKKLLLGFAFLFLGALAVSAQNDTVCVGSTGVSYWVSGMAGSTFSWTVNGGTQASGTNTDSITVDFLSTTNGCIGDPVKLAVVRMPLPDATISNAAALCFSDSTTLTVTLTGTFPWDLTYDDGSGNQVVSITTSPYTINTGSLTASKSYTLVKVEDRLGCFSNLSGTGTASTVTVFPKVVTPSIQHN